MKTLTLRRGKEGSLLRRHPWIFSGAIADAPQDLAEGELVRVLHADGEFVCIGHFAIGSIVVRVLSWEDRPIDQDFWRLRLSESIACRQALGLLRPDNTICRLVHGEGDNLPGLIIDLYGTTAVVQAHSVGMHLVRRQIAQALLDVMPNRLTGIYYKSEGTLPFKANCSQTEGILYGNANNHIALENNLHFSIDWLKGQKTGFFIDQRYNRSLLESYSANRSVLNMFCYTGAFSVYALRGGAERVVSVDSSARAIDLTNNNVELNFGACPRHTGVACDAFEYLEQTPQEWDLIIIDPPAFAKHRDAVHNALRGYTRLNALAISKVRPGGIVFTFSCSQAIDKEQFRLAVFTAATRARREVRILHQLHQSKDHPINIYHPEGEYLKGLVLYVGQ